MKYISYHSNSALSNTVVLPLCPVSRSYTSSSKLNEGTFGVVYKGKVVDDSRLPEGDDGTRALKKLKADRHRVTNAVNPGFPVTVRT